MEINTKWLKYKNHYILNQTPCVGGGSAGVMISGVGETVEGAIDNAMIKIEREEMDLFEACQRKLNLASELLLSCKQLTNE